MGFFNEVKKMIFSNNIEKDENTSQKVEVEKNESDGINLKTRISVNELIKKEMSSAGKTMSDEQLGKLYKTVIIVAEDKGILKPNLESELGLFLKRVEPIVKDVLTKSEHLEILEKKEVQYETSNRVAA